MSLTHTLYGCLRREVLGALDAYLNCGILLHGCARAVCEKCHHSELIQFSCKRRHLCPSCDAKRALLFAEHLHENVLLPYPHSHQVYTIPKRLRLFFKFNRRLLKHLYHAACLRPELRPRGNAWQDCVNDALPDLQTGSVMALHTAGDLLNWHPHAHALSLHGAIDKDGNFYQLDSVDTDYLTHCFADYVFDALLHEELVDQDTVDSMKSWENSLRRGSGQAGFHVFVGEPVAAEDSDARQFLARYLKKSPIALSRLELIDGESGQMVRVNKITDDDTQSRTLDPLQFLAELQQHIPDIREQTVRFLGCYSARTRRSASSRPLNPTACKAPSLSSFDFAQDDPEFIEGSRGGAKRLACPEQSRRALDTHGPLPDTEPPARPSKEWARCIKQVYLVDPLTCPQCGSKMHIKGFIHDHKQITRICKNLGLHPWRAPPPLKTIPLQKVA